MNLVKTGSPMTNANDNEDPTALVAPNASINAFYTANFLVFNANESGLTITEDPAGLDTKHGCSLVEAPGGTPIPHTVAPTS